MDYTTALAVLPAAMTGANLVFSAPADNSIQTYSDTILHIPVPFYYNRYTGTVLSSDVTREPLFPGSVLPVYDVNRPDTKVLRRPKHDTFRPPCGGATAYLTSIGYGKEVGLPDGMQEVYNPCTEKSIILDHNSSNIITEDFRAKPVQRTHFH